MKPIIIIAVLTLVFFACNNRHKLNSDEKRLAQQIVAEEKEKQETEAATSQNNSIIPDTLPPGFRFKEVRSVDPENPPIHLDILGTQENVREFKLSDFATNTNYIKLETPPDSSFFYDHPRINAAGKMYHISSDDRHMFIQGYFGIARFNLEGKFLEQIWKNESGLTVTQKYIMTSPQEFFGVMLNNPISQFNGNLYLRFIDGNNKKVQVIKKEIQDNYVLESPVVGQENLPDTMAGDKLLNIQGARYSQRFPKIYGLSENSWAGINDTWNTAKTGAQFVVFSNKGDTLCAISANKTIQNWSKSTVRAGEPFTYYYKNKLTFLGQYSDTIFRIIPPNKLHPTYILEFGANKVGFMEGLNPDSDLSEKLMLNSIFETNNFLYLRYTKNLNSPRNRKNGTVTFYNALFNKNEKKLYHALEATKSPTNILNDIDGGLPFWPKFVTPKGDMLMLVSGKEIKDYVDSEEFRNRALSEELRQKQIDMANALNENDKIVIIVN